MDVDDPCPLVLLVEDPDPVAEDPELVFCVLVGTIGFRSTEPLVVFGKGGNRLLVVDSTPSSFLALDVPVDPVVEVGLRGVGMMGTAPVSSISKLELIVGIGTPLDVVPAFPPVEDCADGVLVV